MLSGRPLAWKPLWSWGGDTGAMGIGDPPARYIVFDQPAFSPAPFETLWMILRLPATIRKLRPDILFCAGNTYSIVILAMRALLGRRCPLIVAKVSNDLARHDMSLIGRRFYRRWLRLQTRVVDIFVGMAEPTRGEIADAMGVDPSAVRIVEDAALSRAELSVLARPRVKQPRGNRYVAAGRLSPQKNFPLMLRAFARACGPDDTLTIIGTGPERRKLEGLVRTLGLAGRVWLPGHRPSVAASFAQADYFLLSSDYEGVPAVVIEALAAGLPIVATRCSVSMDYLLQSGRFGILTPIGDEAAFVEAMRSIPTHPYSAAAAQAQAAGFTVERSALAYLDVFTAALAARSILAGNADVAGGAAFPKP